MPSGVKKEKREKNPDMVGNEAGCACVGSLITKIKSGSGAVLAHQCTRCGTYNPTVKAAKLIPCTHCHGKTGHFAQCPIGMKLVASGAK